VCGACVTSHGSRGVIALIADDLTGASDAGVQFARRGVRTRVLFDLHDPAAVRDVEAVAIDTDSRAVSAGDAYRRVHEVASALRRAAPRHVYKKIDSTLRGNLGAEIDAVMDAFGSRLAIVAPAFPALGRTTRGGVHYLRGAPVHQTEVGRDLRGPVADARIAQVLAGQSRRPMGLVPLATVADGVPAIRRSVEAHRAHGTALLVCDAETDAHLLAIAASLADQRDVLWVGSAGLAEPVAEALGLPRRRPTPPETNQTPGGPVVLVAGSVSATTRQQVAAVAARPGVQSVTVDPVALVGGPAACAAEQARCEAALAAALAAGDDGLLVVDARPERVERAAQRGAARGLSRSQMAAGIADVLGRLGAAAAQRQPLAGLVLTGGDTARAVCRHLGVSGLDLVADVEPGVPLGRLIGPTMAPLAVTKAGAFGSDQALVRARDQLKGAPPP